MARFAMDLAEYGYRPHEAVAQEGDFSRRGGIIDVFPFTFELPIRIELDGDVIASIRSIVPETGQPLWDHSMAIVLPIHKRGAAKHLQFKEEVPLDNFVDLSAGDYVVHTQHGIGRFLGLERIRTGEKRKDHLVIEYDRHEKLYVPVDQMHLVQKYLAFQSRRPKLFRLGGKEWARVKERAKKGIQKLAWDLLTLQAMRATVQGHSFEKDTAWQEQFEATFPFTETPDQLKATQEVKADMESDKPMDRLLCGDVGYGKTEVAMRAVFKAAASGKQVAFLVPTTILAEQHYKNFSKRLTEFPLRVEMLSRFRTPREQREVVKAVAQGRVDVVIGTHRLLSQDVSFRDLGLVVIDEEQRFGVRSKEKLKAMRLNTDVLTLTATPIPRTLYMSLMGAKDLSMINTPPQNRLPIRTVVVEYDEDLIRQAIARELARKGQVYFLHNRVQDIEKIKERVARLAPAGARIAIGHGQMASRPLEQVMTGFLEAKYDILICTMIVESGIDIPNVNTLIVNNAHTFGLADLHQLRGRVGRLDKPAYAYFMVPRSQVFDSDAKKRLEALQEYSQLGAGFKIAMQDLELRGAGNLLGAQQHGYIAAVGFDLYCRLLKEAVNAFEKTGVQATHETH